MRVETSASDLRALLDELARFGEFDRRRACSRHFLQGSTGAQHGGSPFRI